MSRKTSILNTVSVAFLTVLAQFNAVPVAHAQSQEKSTQPSTAPMPNVGVTPVSNGARPQPAIESSGNDEDFKGKPSAYDWNFSFTSGLGLVADKAGIPLIGGVSKKIIEQGFVPDINNQVHVEGQLGTVFVQSSTVWVWSAHLRWDFEQNSKFTYFALAGLSGNMIPDALGKRDEFFPRVGLGMFYTLTPELKLRFDVSHEWIGAGVTFRM